MSFRNRFNDKACAIHIISIVVAELLGHSCTTSGDNLSNSLKYLTQDVGLVSFLTEEFESNDQGNPALSFIVEQVLR